MKPRFPFLTVGLSIALLAVACAPAAPTEPPAEPAPAAAQPTATVAAVPATEASVAATATAVPVVQPIATSRGPNLEAVDPATVSLASGGLQLVEFFRFTWSTCRAMAPMVHGLEAEYFGKIKFTYLDADDPNTQSFQRTLGFVYQPEFYLLDADGNVLKKLVGFTSEDQFRELFSQYLQ